MITMHSDDIRRGCIRKRRYKTPEQARKVANMAMVRAGHPLYSYGCFVCGGYHITKEKHWAGPIPDYTDLRAVPRKPQPQTPMPPTPSPVQDTANPYPSRKDLYNRLLRSGVAPLGWVDYGSYVLRGDTQIPLGVDQDMPHYKVSQAKARKLAFYVQSNWDSLTVQEQASFSQGG